MDVVESAPSSPWLATAATHRCHPLCSRATRHRNTSLRISCPCGLFFIWDAKGRFVLSLSLSSAPTMVEAAERAHALPRDSLFRLLSASHIQGLALPGTCKAAYAIATG